MWELWLRAWVRNNPTYSVLIVVSVVIVCWLVYMGVTA